MKKKQKKESEYYNWRTLFPANVLGPYYTGARLRSLDTHPHWSLHTLMTRPPTTMSDASFPSRRLALPATAAAERIVIVHSSSTRIATKRKWFTCERDWIPFFLPFSKVPSVVVQEEEEEETYNHIFLLARFQQKRERDSPFNSSSSSSIHLIRFVALIGRPTWNQYHPSSYYYQISTFLCASLKRKDNFNLSLFKMQMIIKS